MHPTVKAARIAGVIYLLLVFTAPLRLMYIPSKLIVGGEPAATANNILANETLFRLGIAGDLLSAAIAIWLMTALYRLFESVDRHQTRLMVLLGGPVVAAVYTVNAMNDLAALMLIRGPDFLAIFDKVQREAFALFFLRMHHQGVVVNQMFWGLWLFPLAILIWKSRFMPRFISVWLVINGITYCGLSLVGVLAPQYEKTLSDYVFPALLAEIAVMLWLLIKGARVPDADAQPHAA